VLLHIGGTSPAGVAAVIAVIFLLIFAMSFAFGPVPEGERRFTAPWFRAWLRASTPRLAIAAAFASVIFVGSALWGGGGSSSAANCENPLAPLSGGAITDARLVTAIGALNDMTSAAQSGDTERMRTLFYTTDAHNLTHDIDRPLRQNNVDAATRLCEHVVTLESQIGGQLDLTAIAQQTTNIAADLQAARGILAAITIATPVVTAGFDPCAQPLAAITTDQLTAQRLQAAIDELHKAATFAQNGNQNDAQAAFVGDPHNLSHDIDGPLRTTDNSLAVKLCQSIVAIELHLGDKYDAQIMQTEATTAADLIQQAGQALGILT
jgi:hypothetical protein